MRLLTRFAFASRRCGLVVLMIFGLRTEASTRIEKIAYNGWTQAFAMSNGRVEAIVVPAVGRVMQLRLTGEKEGPFWENRALDGKSPDSQSEEWIIFGGDKSWPAPQSEWEKITGRAWPPPKAFDAMAVETAVDGEALVLRSKIDPSYGIQEERRITLSEGEAQMKIETIYHKVEGGAIRMGIWVITQMKDPEKVFMVLPPNAHLEQSYKPQSSVLPSNLLVENSWVSCSRSSKESTKIGSEASDLVWADARWILAIHATRERAGEFPDKGSSAEIYTNPDPNKYVELEMLGPLQELRRGESISRSQTYHLWRRSADALDEQVRTLTGAH